MSKEPNPAYSENSRACWRRYGALRRKDPVYQEAQKKRMADWYEANKHKPERVASERARLARKQKEPEEKIKNSARKKVGYEIKMGRMVRLPCSVCGKPKAQAHHEDYSRPLDVMWFCPKHHKEHHLKAQGAQQ